MNDLATNRKVKNEDEIFGKKIGFFARIFGCWHSHLSRPLTIRNQTYSVCLTCGARRKFDIEKLESVGDFYYPPNFSL